MTPAIDKGWIIERMIGAGREELEDSYLRDIKLSSRPAAPVVLEAQSLTLAPAYRDVSFVARGGEVLGIYGFMGCGQLELARTLFGRLQPDRGSFRIGGKIADLANTSVARRAGVAYVAESRRAPSRWRHRNSYPPRNPPGNVAVAPGVVPRHCQFRRKPLDINALQNSSVQVGLELAACDTPGSPI